MNSARALILLLCLFTLGFAAAGCGGDSGSDDTADKPAQAAADAGPSKVDLAYAKQLEAGGDELSAVGTAFESATDWASYAAATKQLEAAIGTFKEMTPPSDVEAEHADLVASLTAALTASASITENSTEAADAAAQTKAIAALESADSTADSILAQLG